MQARSIFLPHEHLEVLGKRPPPTKEGQFVTVGMNGDISFCDIVAFCAILRYIKLWSGTTFLLQSKNPDFFNTFIIPDNVIICTTLESNRTEFHDSDYGSYDSISTAPNVNKRLYAMHRITSRKAITIEPILDFDVDILFHTVLDLNPEFVWIGYDSHPKRNKLPEPKLEKTQEFINELIYAGISVRQKLIRRAWSESTTHI